MTASDTTETEQTPPSGTPARLLSLDAFRGADMLCILGLDTFVYALAAALPQSEFLREIRMQFGHKVWDGLVIYDCIFPAFVFISGMAMAFSFEKKRERGEGNLRMTGALLRRALILVALGAILQGALSFHFSETRWASVLGLIGVANALGGLLALFLKTPKRIALAMFALAGTLAAAQFLGGDFTPGGSVNAKLDALLLPGKFHYGIYDPEGILCVVSASVAVLAGYLVGLFLVGKKQEGATWETAGKLAAIGAGTLLLAHAAGTFYPIIKNMWTQSFVFAAVGWSLLTFAVFYTLFDVLKLEKLAFFFKIIGVNAIAIYVLKWIFPFKNLSALIFGGVAELSGIYAGCVLAVGTIALEWALLLWLYRRKIFFKI